MNYLDIIIFVILLAFFFLGLRRGFVFAILQLAGIVLVIFMMRQFGAVIRQDIHVRLGISETWAIILGYIAIFIIIMVLAKIITVLMQKFVKLINLNWLDRLLGGFVYLVFGFAIVVIIVLVLEVSSIANSFGQARARSSLYSTARVLVNDIINNYISEIPGSPPDRGRHPRYRGTEPV